MKKKITISFYIFIILVFVWCIKALAVTGIITEGTVNVRAKTDTNSKKITYVFKNDKVEVLEKDGSWYKVKVKGKTGYIYEKYVKVDEKALLAQTSEQEANAEKTEDVETKLTLKNEASLRLVPNLSSTVIMKVSSNTKFIILKQMDTWTYVSISGLTGWIRTDEVMEENAAIEENTTAVANETEEEEKTEAKEEKKTETKTTKTKTTTSGKKAYVQYDTVNLREKASATSKVIAKLKLNDEVTILQKVNNVWAKVSYDGKTGYVSQDLLGDKKKTTTKKNTSSTTTSRSGETTERESQNKEDNKTSETETTMVAKTTSKETQSTTQTTNNENSNKTTTTTKQTKTTNKVTGEDIAAYAKQYLGYKYVYGAASPSTGFDCSGLVYYVYKHFGYTLSRSSSGLASCGKKVEKKDLQPGDILIYKNNALTKIGHVGIYIGNNKMIHASEPGVGVIITDIDAKSYKYPQRYVMARRIVN